MNRWRRFDMDTLGGNGENQAHHSRARYLSLHTHIHKPFEKTLYVVLYCLQSICGLMGDSRRRFLVPILHHISVLCFDLEGKIRPC